MVCSQNHDQIGNRARGERLATLVGTEAFKLAAGITLLSPLTPLLFMGEEYGEIAPFQYFVSHGDQDLVEAVRKGRTEEFSSFGWAEEVPDPQAESTFATSRLNHSLKERDPHRTLLCFYKHLIRFRTDHSLSQREDFTVQELGNNVLLLLFGPNPRSGQKHRSLAAVFHFGKHPAAQAWGFREPGNCIWNRATQLGSALARLCRRRCAPAPQTKLPSSPGPSPSGRKRWRIEPCLTRARSGCLGRKQRARRPLPRSTFLNCDRPPTVLPESAIPSATYRLQFSRNFRFEDAIGILDYLRDLGVTHVYASPILGSRRGSEHGYDATDPTRIDPDLGSEEDLYTLQRELHQRGMGLVLDLVPNHMAASSENPWWMDVLENGPGSAFASYFDIDWHPGPRSLEGKVLLPVLGRPFGEVLDSGELALLLDQGNSSSRYYESTFPLAPKSYRQVLIHRIDELKEFLAEESHSLPGVRRNSRVAGIVVSKRDCHARIASG